MVRCTTSSGDKGPPTDLRMLPSLVPQRIQTGLSPCYWHEILFFARRVVNPIQNRLRIAWPPAFLRVAATPASLRVFRFLRALFLATRRPQQHGAILRAKYSLRLQPARLCLQNPSPRSAAPPYSRPPPAPPKHVLRQAGAQSRATFALR